jgi:hypothetical protein
VLTVLPVDLPPDPGEALPAWLHRTADLLRVDAGLLYRHLGLRPEGRTLRQAQLALHQPAVRQISRATDLDLPEVERTLAASLPGLDVRALLDPAVRSPDRDVQRRQWIFLTGTRWCSQCVREGRPWRVEWQLPWAFACGRHKVLLLDSCPRCGARPDLVPRGAQARAAASTWRCACSYRWVDGEAGAPVDGAAMALQADLVSALDGEAGDLWGTSAEGIERLAAWRAAGAYAASTDPANAWSHRPYLVPPPTAARSAELAVQVSQLVRAPDLAVAAEAFGAIAASGRGWGEPRVWDHIPTRTPLAPVVRRWLRRSGRVHARLRRTQREAFTLTPVRHEVIPTLAPPDALPESWQQVAVPAEVMRRAALSLAVARLAGAGTWAVAGEWLRIDAVYASRLMRHVLHVLGPGAAQELTDSAQEYGRELSGVVVDCARPPGPPLRYASELAGFDRSMRE